MKRKRFFSFVAVGLALLLQLGTFAPLRAAADSGSGIFDNNPFITGISLTTKDGKTIDENSDFKVEKDSEVLIGLDFTVPETTIPVGTTYGFSLATLPHDLGTAIDSGTISPNPGPLYVTDEGTGEQVEIAQYQVNSDGTGTITFNSNVNHYGGVKGRLQFDCWFDKESIPNTTPVPLEFTVEGQSSPTTINVHFNQPGPTVVKTEESFDPSASTVTWKVTVNDNHTTLVNGKLLDSLPDGLTYKSGTFKVTDMGADGKDNTVVYQDSVSGGTGTFSAAGNKLEYDFAATTDHEYLVEYTTDLSSGYYGKNVTNTATLDSDAGPVSSSATVNHAPTYIAKTAGTVTHGATSITWTVTFNQAGGTLNDLNITDPITDPITGGMTLDTDKGVYLDGTTPVSDSSGTSPTQYYSYTDGTLTFHADSITGQHTLTFTTKLPDDYWQKNEETGVSNTATLKAGNNTYLSSGQVQAGTGTVGNTVNKVLEKSGAGYDADTHTIHWSVTVNGGGNTLKKPTLTDAIPSSGASAQTYVPGTFTVKDSAGSSVFIDGSTTYKDGTFSSAGGTLIYTFAGDVNGNITGKYTVTYDTTVNSINDYAGNSTSGDDSTKTSGRDNSKNYTNSAELKTSDSIVSTTGNQTEKVTSDVLEKSAGYDHTTGVLTWTLTVNKNQMPMKDVTLTDTLGGKDADGNDTNLENFDLLTEADNPSHPLKVGGTTLARADSAAAVTSADNQYYYDSQSRKLTIYLGDIGSDTKTVTFDMKVHDPNTYFATTGDKQISNTANLTDSTGVPAGYTAHDTIGNDLVTKTGDYAKHNDYIDWIVHVNQNQIQLTDLTLTDHLQAGLVLDPSTIRLYPQTLHADGSLTPDGTTAQAIDNAATAAHVSEMKPSSVKYNADTGDYSLTLPPDSGTDTITKPYVLIFRTYVDEAHNGDSFSNSIGLTAKSVGQSAGSQEQLVAYGTSSSDASGTLAKLTLTKADSVSAATTIPGATYGLYDGTYGTLIDTQTTGEDGTLVFKYLHYSSDYTYSIKELDPPDNYQTSNETLKFYLVKGEGLYVYNDQTGEYTLSSPSPAYTVRDQLKAGAITFVKKDQGGTPLPGIEFTLCDSGGNPVSIPGVTTVQKSGDDGTVTFTGIPYGNYTVKESTPADYAPTDLYIANLNDATAPDGTLDLGTVTNTIKTAGIALTKYAEGGGTLEGATFALTYDQAGNEPVTLNGSPVTLTTDGDGAASVSGIPYGDYYLVETSAPDHYQTAAPTPVSLHDNNTQLQGGVLAVHITDALKRGAIRLTKHGDDGTPLAGATFVLRNAAGDQVGDPQVSDSDGSVVFRNVPYGSGYSVTETHAPADFNLLTASVTGIDLYSSEISLGVFSDARKTGTITLTKVGESGAALPGATFALYDAAGSRVGSPQVSDADGKVSFTGVPMKDGYTVREVEAPANYGLHEAIPVNLHTAFYDCGKIADRLLRGGITVVKSDSAGRRLAGATFALYDGDGGYLAEATTGSDGTALFSNLLYGKYAVQEVKAPSGYDIDTAMHAVTLGKDSPAPTVRVKDSKKSTADIGDNDTPTGWMNGQNGGRTANPDTGRAGPAAGASALALLLGGGGFLCADTLLRRRKRRAGR